MWDFCVSFVILWVIVESDFDLVDIPQFWGNHVKILCVRVYFIFFLINTCERDWSGLVLITTRNTNSSYIPVSMCFLTHLNVMTRNQNHFSFFSQIRSSKTKTIQLSIYYKKRISEIVSIHFGTCLQRSIKQTCDISKEKTKKNRS